MSSKKMGCAMAIVLTIAAAGMLYAQEKPANIAGYTANNGDTPPGNAMSLSLPHARAKLKQAPKNAYTDAMKSQCFMGCVTWDFKSIEFHFTVAGFSVATPYTYRNQKHLINWKDTVDFSKTRAFSIQVLTKKLRVPHPSRSLRRVGDHRSLWAL